MACLNSPNFSNYSNDYIVMIIGFQEWVAVVESPKFTSFNNLSVREMRALKVRDFAFWYKNENWVTENDEQIKL